MQQHKEQQREARAVGGDEEDVRGKHSVGGARKARVGEVSVGGRDEPIIVSKLVAKRAALWARLVDLSLPQAPLVPTRQRAPDRAPPRERQLTPLELAEQGLAEMEATKAAAEVRVRQATRALARLQPPGFSGENLSTKSRSYFFFHPLEMPEEEQQRRKVLFDALFAGEWALRTAELEVDCAKRDVTSAHESVTLERKFQEQEKEAAARQRQMEERLEALRLESEREAAETRAA